MTIISQADPWLVLLIPSGKMRFENNMNTGRSADREGSFNKLDVVDDLTWNSICLAQNQIENCAQNNNLQRNSSHLTMSIMGDNTFLLHFFMLYLERLLQERLLLLVSASLILLQFSWSLVLAPFP